MLQQVRGHSTAPSSSLPCPLTHAALRSRPQAEFILAHGTEALGTSAQGDAAQPCSLDRLKQLLEECAAAAAARGAPPPPMVVANPDVVTVAGSELRWGVRGGRGALAPRRGGAPGASRHELPR